VAALSIKKPMAHGALTLWHALLSSVFEYVVTPSHASHMRLAVDEPADISPVPTGHVRHAAQSASPADALNVPLAQLAQVKSLEIVEASFIYSPAAHGTRTGWHALPPLLLENVVTPSHAAHVRSAVAEPAVAWP
jgi:hypothetical protein